MCVGLTFFNCIYPLSGAPQLRQCREWRQGKVRKDLLPLGRDSSPNNGYRVKVTETPSP